MTIEALWRQELANLHLELGMAAAYEREAERTSRSDQADRSREVIAVMEAAIQELRSKANPIRDGLRAEGDSALALAELR